MTKNLTDLLTENSECEFTYVGTIWGDSTETCNGSTWAAAVLDLGSDGEIIPHPAHGGDDGYYEQAGNIWYKSGDLQEKVLERL